MLPPAPSPTTELHERLIALALGTPWFFKALLAVRALGLAHWCIGAGAVRNLVWDALHGYATPSALADIDVAYFDPADPGAARDATLQARLGADCPGLPWEVTNQAGVHLWFEQVFGQRVDAYASLEEAVASWPEMVTAVGITLAPDGACRVIAPHGLDDLFTMTVRHNPVRASHATYLQRIAHKRYPERWPQATIIL